MAMEANEELVMQSEEEEAPDMPAGEAPDEPDPPGHGVDAESQDTGSPTLAGRLASAAPGRYGS